jgi:hypothetical protein
MRFNAYSVWRGQRCQAACTTYPRLLSVMSPSIYLCVGDIRAIACEAGGGPDSKYVASMMDNKNSPFLVDFVASTIELSSKPIRSIYNNMQNGLQACG